MIERALAAVLLILAAGTVALLIRSAIARRTHEAEGRPLPDGLAGRLADTGIVYFFGPRCATCAQQALVLDRLERDTGVPVVRVDAVEEQDLAAALNVVTVPATVIVRGRQIHSINLGFCSDAALSAQLAA